MSPIKIGTPEIIPYRGYASALNLYLKGRVLLAKDIVRGYSKNQWKNIRDTFRRFRSKELPNMTVKMSVGNYKMETKTDREGYFTFDEVLTHSVKFEGELWHPVELQLSLSDKELQFKSEIIFPSSKSSFGIISDIDDTVLKSYMGSWLKLRMLYATFVKDGFQRRPMEGMVELLNKLITNRSHGIQNPIFYVSNSPWNLYDMIVEFMEYHGIPKGPILLRDFGVNPIESFSGHKMATITKIFETYPDMSFILFGDTASKDADHYLNLARIYEGRVKAIYIRFTDNTRNARRVEQLIKSAKDIHALVIRSSQEIYEDAQKIGLF